MASAMVQVNARITPELHDAIMREAHRDNITVTAVLNRALKDYFSVAGERKGKGK